MTVSIAEKNRLYYAANRERLRRDQAEYYRRNAEAIKSRMVANRRAKPEDPEARRARKRDWYERKLAAEPGYFAELRSRRRALEVGDADYDYVWYRDFGICHLCGQGVERANAEFDHVVPLSRGGSHTNDNVKVAHRFCNRSKGTRLIA